MAQSDKLAGTRPSPAGIACSLQAGRRALSSTCKAEAHQDASMGVLWHFGLVVQDPGPRDGRRPFGYAQPCWRTPHAQAFHM